MIAAPPDLRGQPCAVGIVDVDHRVCGREIREEQALGPVVLLHRLVEIEMVLGEVGEDGRGEMDRIGAVERQRVGGDLHHARLVAGVEHLGERALEIDRLRRRAQDLMLNAPDHALHRPQQPGLAAGGLEQRTHQERRRGLAVGPGDADGLEARGRISVEASRDRRHRGPHRLHLHLGDARGSAAARRQARPPLGPRRPSQNRARPACSRARRRTACPRGPGGCHTSATRSRRRRRPAARRQTAGPGASPDNSRRPDGNGSPGCVAAGPSLTCWIAATSSSQP